MKFIPQRFKLIIFPLILVYSLLCLILYFSQNYLIYFPISEQKNNTEKFFNVIKDVKTEQPLGLITKEKKENAIVLFHGNAGNASMRDFYLEFFGKNYQIIIAEYPGFGLNTEAISKEKIIHNAQILMKTIKKENYKEIILVGESLGTGVASQMAKEFNISKLLLITPYSSILDVAQNQFKILPIKYILNNNFNNIENLNSYKGNVMLIIAENDQTINPKFAYKLFDNINTNKQQITILKAGHNDWIYNLTQQNKDSIYNFLH